MPLSAGGKLGHYEIVSMPGKGGMGEVGRRTILGWAFRQAPVGNRQTRCPAPGAAKACRIRQGSAKDRFFCALALSRSD
jgi:hypothetical protein